MEIFMPPAHPGEIDFAAWLSERTPAGAALLEVRLPGALGGLRLPQIRDAALGPAPERRRRGRGSAPALHAARLVDIDALTPRQLAESGLFAFTTERAARQHVRDGRFVGSEIGLWPWAVVGGQALPRAWWLDERFALALARWAGAHLRAA
jgi:hypothetical protein